MKAFLVSCFLLLITLTSARTQEENQPEGILVVGGHQGILLMKPDGSHVKQLTDFFAASVVWSPDSRYIAFGGFNLFVIGYDGSDLKNLTNQSAWYTDLQWSPDGSKIAFGSNVTGDWEVYAIRPDGSDLINLSNHAGSEDRSPTWSPEGQRLAFESDRDGNWEIYGVDEDGQNLENLTNHPAHDSYPAWSPSDLRIAFVSNRNGKDALHLMDSNGQNVELLFQPEPPGPDVVTPVWAPNGSQILVLLDIAMTQTYVIDLTARKAQRLTGWHVDLSPRWSPGGQYIAFARQSFGPGDIEKMKTDGIYIMRTDGLNLTRMSPLRTTTLDWGLPPHTFTAVAPSYKRLTLWGDVKRKAE